MSRSLDSVRWLALVVVAVVAVFYYRSMFGFTAFLFNDPLEDMSHGWIVPFVSVYVIWCHRRALRELAGGPSWAGAAWVVGFLAVAWFGGRGGQSRIEQVSFIGLVWAIPYAFWGSGVERLMRFPAAYLLFTVPISSFIDFFTIHLRMLSVAMATGVLNGFGMAVERSGTALFSQTPGGAFNVDVADPCSGIRSLFAMMALAAAYAYITQKEFWNKWILFLCSVPIAVLGNIVRIMSICVVASWCGQETATGYYHDYSGFVIFLVGVCLIFSFGERIKKMSFSNWRLSRSTGEKRADGPRSGAVERQNLSLSYGIVLVVSALACAVFVSGYLMPPPKYGAASFVADRLPEQVGDFRGGVPWFCQDPQCLKMAEEQSLRKGVVNGIEGYVCPACGKLMGTKSLGETTVLPKDTVILKRNYRSESGVVYSVSAVVQGTSRNSIHRAELCLPSQGFIMEKARRVPMRLTGRSSPLMARLINAHRPAGAAKMPIVQDGQSVWVKQPSAADESAKGADSISLLYWFLSRDRECCSHTQRILTDVWDRSMHNRINRWVMIAVNISPALEDANDYSRLEAFLSEFYPDIIVGQKTK